MKALTRREKKYMENVTKEEVVTCEGKKSEMDFQISSLLTCKFIPNKMRPWKWLKIKPNRMKL